MIKSPWLSHELFEEYRPMNTNFAAEGLDDAIALQRVREYCKTIMSLSYSSVDCIDTCMDILDIINGANK
jgi:hypothetical protein